MLGGLPSIGAPITGQKAGDMSEIHPDGVEGTDGVEVDVAVEAEGPPRVRMGQHTLQHSARCVEAISTADLRLLERCVAKVRRQILLELGSIEAYAVNRRAAGHIRS